MSASFLKLLSVEASTTRLVLDSSGKSSGPTVALSSIDVSEPMPVTAEIRNRLVLETPHEVLMIFCDDSKDVKPGDKITLSDSVNVTNSKAYPVRAVERWPWITGKTYKMLIVEDLKT